MEKLSRSHEAGSSSRSPTIGRDSRWPRRKWPREGEGEKKVARWWSSVRHRRRRRGGDVYRGRSVMTIRVHTRVVRVGSDYRCVSAKEDNWLAAAVVLAGGLLTSHPVLWLVAISFGPRHIKVRRRFVRPQCLDAENCHRQSSGTWFSSGDSPATFASTYFFFPPPPFAGWIYQAPWKTWRIEIRGENEEMDVDIKIREWLFVIEGGDVI